MFTPAIADQLRAKGFDVVAVAAEPHLRSLSDPELHRWSREQGRRVVTENV